MINDIWTTGYYDMFKIHNKCEISVDDIDDANRLIELYSWDEDQDYIFFLSDSAVEYLL